MDQINNTLDAPNKEAHEKLNELIEQLGITEDEINEEEAD